MIKKDLIATMTSKMPKTLLDVNDIKLLFKTYVEYYLQNPNVFKFFYFRQLSKPDKKCAMHGLLMLYFSNEENLTEKDGCQDLEKMVDYLLK